MQPEQFKCELPSLSGLVSLVLMLVLAGIVLFYAKQRQQEAIVMALKVRQQVWMDHLAVLQPKWQMQNKPSHWNVDGTALSMTPAGWPIADNEQECTRLWQLLLAEKPAPLISHIRSGDGGCAYEAVNVSLQYNYRRQSLVFSEIHR